MIERVHFVKLKEDSSIYLIRAIDWKKQTVLIKLNDETKQFIPFSQVEFMLDSDKEMVEMFDTYMKNNY